MGNGIQIVTACVQQRPVTQPGLLRHKQGLAGEHPLTLWSGCGVGACSGVAERQRVTRREARPRMMMSLLEAE